jgi:hypothetical protein
MKGDCGRCCKSIKKDRCSGCLHNSRGDGSIETEMIVVGGKDLAVHLSDLQRMGVGVSIRSIMITTER